MAPRTAQSTDRLITLKYTFYKSTFQLDSSPMEEMRKRLTVYRSQALRRSIRIVWEVIHGRDIKWNGGQVILFCQHGPISWETSISRKSCQHASYLVYSDQNKLKQQPKKFDDRVTKHLSFMSGTAVLQRNPSRISRRLFHHTLQCQSALYCLKRQEHRN